MEITRLIKKVRQQMRDGGDCRTNETTQQAERAVTQEQVLVG